jgi:hypothetical protein
MRRMADAATWKQRVAAWRASGQTAAEYSKQHGLTLSSLQRWSHRLRREPPEPPAAAPAVRLARVERVASVSPEPTAVATVPVPGVVVEISGARVRVERGADAATVAMVLAALGAGGRR